MARKSMKSALSASLKAENDAVKTRFEKAESLLGDKPEPNQQAVAHSPIEKEKAEKERVIRDSFTLPSSDYELIAAVRQRCLQAATTATKSEVIRAGLHALMEMPEDGLVELIKGLEKIKTGRPSKKK